MRFARSFIALAALSTAAACADPAGITAPASASRDAAPGGGWVGSDNVVATDTTGRGGWTGSGNLTAPPEGEDAGAWAGTENVIAPTDTTRTGRGGGWVGSDN